MSSPIRFSIVLPVRNGGHYVKECVNSILSQSLPFFDLLVLDNQSNDGTLEWVSSINDKRIKIFPSDNYLSMEDNWGRIISIPKNEFITIIGHDDILHIDYLKAMDTLIDNHPSASLYQSHFCFIDAKGAFLRQCKPMAEIEYLEGFLESIFTDSLDTMGTGYMMRSADYDKMGGIQPYPNLLFADHELWINLTALSYKATTKEECFSFRLHQSVSKMSVAVKYIRAFNRFMEYLETVSKKNQKAGVVIKRLVVNYIFFYCRSLSHRLLKTPVLLRESMTVNGFIRQCKIYADQLSPNNNFDPGKDFSIRLAKRIDDNSVFLNIYLLFRKFYKIPLYS